MALLTMTRVLFGLLFVVMFAVAGVRLHRARLVGNRRHLVRELAVSLLPAAAILSILAAADAAKFGSPWLTGYHQWRPEAHLPVGNAWDGLHGFLFDMQGSVLWYFPVLIAALPACWRFWTRHKGDAAVIGSVFLLFLAVLAPVPTWLGDWTHGPRYLLFVLPALGLPFVLVIDELLDRPRRWWKPLGGVAIVAMLLYSGYLQERVNRLDFFVTYRVTGPIKRGSFPREIAQYFLGHHRGVVCADLVRHRRNPRELPFVRELQRQGVGERALESYVRFLTPLLYQNYYWVDPLPPTASSARSVLPAAR